MFCFDESRKEIAEKLDHVINFNTSSTHITLKRGEMISTIIEFYILTVIRNSGSEDKAKKNLISSNEAEKWLKIKMIVNFQILYKTNMLLFDY